MHSLGMIVFELNRSYGFFSIFFFLCKAYLYAKSKQQPFYIHPTQWAYDGGQGWHGYFTSLECYKGPKEKALWIRHGEIPSFVPKYSLRDYMACIQEVFVLQPSLASMVDAYIRAIKGPYIAVYVRRGDKHTESSFIPEKEIVARLDMSACDTLFVQTDDYSVVERMRDLLPDKQVICRIPASKRGHYQSAMYLQNARDKNPYKKDAVAFNDIKDRAIVYDDTVELLTSCLISARAQTCWVDLGSNVGRFLKLLAPETVHSYSGGRFDPDACCDPYWPFS